MARFLLISLGVKGHVNPIFAVAEHLIRDGHTVGWLSRHVGHVAVEPSSSSIEIPKVDWTWLPPGTRLDFTGAARDLDKYVVNNREWRLNCIAPLVPRVREAIRSFDADLLVIDGQVYPGVIAANLEGRPFAGIVTSPAFLAPDYECDLTRALGMLHCERAEIFRGYGVEPCFAAWDYLSPLANFVLALPEFIGAEAVAALPRPVELVGPSISFERADDPADFPWHRLAPHKPLVYASFGTVWYAQPDLFRMVAQAADMLGLQVVAVVGALMDTRLVEELPASTVAVRYAPQLRLLERAAVCVTHGGANTVAEALHFGVPQLAIPLCTDQPVNGHFVARSGAGISILPRDLTIERCREALAGLVASDSPYRATAERLRAAAGRRNGAAVTAERIAGLLR
ncbi:MAG TPA: nucleotide disphospho-sugar-binding domain-containing protein [Stellaceae bacterium]